MQAEKAALIKASSNYRELTRAGYIPLEVLADTFHFLAYDENGHCHFLQDKLCGLHKQHGLSHKPVICRLYPFTIVNTPDGHFVSLLFSCPSVIAGHGKPVEQHSEELQALFLSQAGKVPLLSSIKEHVLVTQETTMSWSDYLTVEQSLLHNLPPAGLVDYLLNAACLLAEEPFSTIDFSQASSLTTSLRASVFPEFLSALGASPSWQRKSGHPASAEVAVMTRYLRNQIFGKLLLIGPSLVCRLLLVGAALAIVERRAPERGLEQAFIECEEQYVSQSNEHEELLLELESIVLELAQENSGS